MKKLVLTLCLTALVAGAYAQGTIKFANSGVTLISYQATVGGPTNATPAYNAADPTTWYYFAVLSAPQGTTDPTLYQFAGIYATNTGVAGRLQGGNLLAGEVANSTWPAATSRAFLVAGWSGDQGPTFSPSWFLPGNIHSTDPTATGGVAGTPGGLFGFSIFAFGRAGGTDPVTGLSYQALAAFSGSTISSGFVLTPVPEPTTMALAGLGAAALLIFRRRK